MPSEQTATRLQPEALEAFLDGILAELDEPADPVALDEIRKAFRKRVPFAKRSYAAAALILRAAGLSRGSGRPGPKEAFVPAQRESRNERVKAPAARDARGRGQEAKSKQAQNAKAGDDGRPPQPPRARYMGEGTTLFFSMGKRQRFYPRILIDLVQDVAIVQAESIGEVRAFDNYSFADIDPEKAAKVIQALDGYEFRGRKLSVGPAKKRDEQGGETG